MNEKHPGPQAQPGIIRRAATAVANAILPAKNAPEKLDPQKTPAQAETAAEKKAAEEIQTVPLFAWQAPTTNRKLLVAYHPGTDPTDPTKLVSVNVRTNVNFTRHLRLRARPVAGSLNAFDLVGPCPRWKGRY